MRVYDVLKAVDFLVNEGFEKITVWGEGEAGIVALFAAALDERLTEVTAQMTPVSLISSSFPPFLHPFSRQIYSNTQIFRR